jgi:hypothetical protein
MIRIRLTYDNIVNQAPMTPEGSLDNIASGSYYLVGINERHHREYARKP